MSRYTIMHLLNLGPGDFEILAIYSPLLLLHPLIEQSGYLENGRTWDKTIFDTIRLIVTCSRKRLILIQNFN